MLLNFEIVEASQNCVRCLLVVVTRTVRAVAVLYHVTGDTVPVPLDPGRMSYVLQESTARSPGLPPYPTNPGTCVGHS